MENSLVSVIIPCYNQAQYLDECLQSVLDQTYKNWECIIVNDGSPDHTDEIVQDWLNKDSRFVYLEKKNGGVISARNAGIEKAKGFYILPLDADDYITANFLEKAVDNILKDEDIKIVYSKVQCFGFSSHVIMSEFRGDTIKFRNQIVVTALYRKSDWVLNQGYDPNMEGGFEDWEFWVNTLKRGGRALLVKDACLFYRTKEVSRYSDLLKQKKKQDRLRNYMFLKHYDLYGTDAITLAEYYMWPESVFTLRKIINIVVKKIKSKFSL